MKDNRVTGFRPKFCPETGTLVAESIFSRWNYYWKTSNKHGGGLEDGHTAELVEALERALHSKGAPRSHEELRLLASMSSGWTWNWDSQQAVEFILNGIGPGKRAVVPIQPVSPGGVIDAIEKDDNGIYISFGNNVVVELPTSAALYPWVTEDSELEEGVPLGDYVPRKEYSISDLYQMSADTLNMIVNDAKGLVASQYADYTVYPIEFVAPEDRLGVLHDGKVKTLFAQVEPRKVYLTDETDVKTGLGSMVLHNSKFRVPTVQEKVLT
jgi:hypothetical protein